MSSKQTVLHVDDDPDTLELSALTLERLGGDDVDVETATDATEALELLDSAAVDCLVTDSLRLADGQAFVVAARERDASLPIVFYTGKAWDEVAADALEARISQYVRKGDLDGVEAVAERALELSSRDRTPKVEAADFCSEAVDDADAGEVPEDPSESFPAEVADSRWTVAGVHDWDADDELVTTVANVVEAYTGVDVANAEPLFTAVDLEAVETVLQPRADDTPRYDVQVRFPYRSWEVAISSDGYVAVRDLPETGDE
ncbi:response regulator [Halogeometricum limi]|uniref:Response regulator receiver domain-containing protein n=1 Tax=Halogeometricum limi TaxID=555875 RepID=A0A1I6HDE1_9EURY|nr:HalOD1 output domain-containing protein [Halogeometricum limi]SFR52394.1 Response regulator receiver domain-containing protein [Halogeometricum limi]